MDAGHTARSLARLEQGGFLLQEVKANDRMTLLQKLKSVRCIDDKEEQ